MSTEIKNSQPIIEVRDLVKKFGSFVADDRLTFDVYPGEIFGFLGANGAGKTTAIRMICGLLEPTSGKLKVAGFDGYHEREKIKRNIGYMSQKFSLYEDMTIYENIRLYAGIYGIPRKVRLERTDEMLQKLQLTEHRNSLVGGLPLGWKQKLSFSLALLHDPKIVFLDEPSGGVDPLTRRTFWDLIYEAAHKGVTIFVTTHYMDEAEYCDRVAIMSEGKIVALDTPQRLKEVYEADSMDGVFLKIARNKE
ncbi:MAG: ABC transporter ATP-binding protein [Marinilabiliales bacterium]|nr:ABC transporter ATP-binding protein [Marinilabiliales bacterium]